MRFAHHRNHPANSNRSHSALSLVVCGGSSSALAAFVVLASLSSSFSVPTANRDWNNLGTDFNTTANWSGGVLALEMLRGLPLSKASNLTSARLSRFRD